jgi:CheY-like chemotaxis protein
MERKIRILVAEADSVFRDMVEESLRESRSSYHLKKVSTGEKCLQELKREKFDVLLLDHTLPDGDGLDWLRKFNDQGIGILFPLALELYELSPRLLKKGEMRPHNPWLSGIVTASVLLGGFMLRYVVVYAGQMAKIVS